jgi:multidrug efflux pump
LRVNQDEARRLGLSSAALASILNTVVSGTVVTQVRDSIYLVNVVARARDDERASIETLRTMQVALPGGQSVPLSQFVTFDYGLDTPLVWRRDRVPTLTVAADVAPGILPETAVSALAPKIDELRRTLPPSYRIDVGGTVEESAKSQASVIAVVPLMLLIMLTVLMAQLRSFKLLGLVLCIAPLGLVGVVGALLLSGKPLGFVALLGILALIGIITKNAVILIGQIEAERSGGKGVVEAALDASTTRFRPIMLTAISTVLGMIPIAPTVFWGPMAYAIMGGLLVATVLTLILLPTLYVTVFDRRSSAAGNVDAVPTVAGASRS